MERRKKIIANAITKKTCVINNNRQEIAQLQEEISKKDAQLELFQSKLSELRARRKKGIKSQPTPVQGERCSRCHKVCNSNTDFMWQHCGRCSSFRCDECYERGCPCLDDMESPDSPDAQVPAEVSVSDVNESENINHSNCILCGKKFYKSGQSILWRKCPNCLASRCSECRHNKCTCESVLNVTEKCETCKKDVCRCLKNCI